MQLWYQYDTDGSGYIEADELKVGDLRMESEMRFFVLEFLERFAKGGQ